MGDEDERKGTKGKKETLPVGQPRRKAQLFPGPASAGRGGQEPMAMPGHGVRAPGQASRGGPCGEPAREYSNYCPLGTEYGAVTIPWLVSESRHCTINSRVGSGGKGEREKDAKNSGKFPGDMASNRGRGIVGLLSSWRSRPLGGCAASWKLLHIAVPPMPSPSPRG